MPAPSAGAQAVESHLATRTIISLGSYSVHATRVEARRSSKSTAVVAATTSPMDSSSRPVKVSNRRAVSGSYLRRRYSDDTSVAESLVEGTRSVDGDDA